MKAYQTNINYRDELTGDSPQNEKQRLSDTFLTFLPKNTSGYTYVNQLIDVQIPKSEHVINLAKAYISLKLQIPLKLDANFAGAADRRYFIGLYNSATMFDQIEIHSNNKVIVSDTFTQVNARIWQMSKPTSYHKANPHTFINIDDITMNKGLVVYELDGTTTAGTTEKNAVFTMKIPLPMLFNCFDNCEAFSTTQLNDNVTLTMQLSTPDKYLCLFTADADGKVLKVTPFGIEGSVKRVYYNEDHYVEYSTSETEPNAYKIDEGFRIICPGHYPTEEEKIEYNNVVANGGWMREFSTFVIQAQDANFGASSVGNGTSGSSASTALNFNSSVANLYGVMMLAAHNHTYTVFDKPLIDCIEMNASEMWKLANGHTHTGNTYENGDDMYMDLMNALGQQSFKNMSRFDTAVTKDCRKKGDITYVKVTSTFEIQLNNANNAVTGRVADSFDWSVEYVYKPGEHTATCVQDDTAHTRTVTIVDYLPLNGENSYTQLDYTIGNANDAADAITDDTPVINYVENNDDVTNDVDYTAADDTDPAIFEWTVGFWNRHEKYRCYDSETLGSYIQYYRFAPSNQLGYSADYFSNQLNYKYKSLYHDEDNGFIFTTNNYDNSTMFCCCHTLSFLVFKEGGIDIINPFSEELDVRVKFSGNYGSYCGNGHGLAAIAPALIKPATDLITGGVRGLRKLVKENRHHHNQTLAYTILGPDLYQKHQGMIDSHTTMAKFKFKRFINNLMKMEQRLKDASAMSASSPTASADDTHGVIVKHGIAEEPEEIAEPATFDDLNLEPFVQSYSADLADMEYKNQLVLDYKYRFNTVKLRLNSFGSEAAMAGNNYHGRIGDWFRRVGRKIKGWFKKEGKHILKNVGSDLLGVAKEYASKILTGEMKMSDLKGVGPDVKQKVIDILKNRTDGTSVGGFTNDAIGWYNKWKNGQLSWSDIPRDMIARVKELDMKNKSGQDHGLIIKHGFVSGPVIKPTELYSVQKQRIKQLMGRNPMELRRKDLRKLYRFNYLKQNGVIDASHGRWAELMKQRYPDMFIKPVKRDPLSPADKGLSFVREIKKPNQDFKKIGHDVFKYRDKWRKMKPTILQNEHGIGFIEKMKERMAKLRTKGVPEADIYRKRNKKAKKFLKKWTDRLREIQKQKEEPVASTPSNEEHGVIVKHGECNEPDYKKMKAMWKKYKAQYKK